MSNLGWSAAEPEVGQMMGEVGPEGVVIPVSACGINASSRLFSFGVSVPRVPLRSTRGYS